MKFRRAKIALVGTFLEILAYLLLLHLQQTWLGKRTNT